MPLIISGVVWRLKSGLDPRYWVLNCQATSSELKLPALIWSSGAYLVEPRSPPHVRHSPFFAPVCADTTVMHKPETSASAGPRRTSSDRNMRLLLPGCQIL